jgi:hypothetical protein
MHDIRRMLLYRINDGLPCRWTDFRDQHKLTLVDKWLERLLSSSAFLLPHMVGDICLWRDRQHP